MDQREGTRGEARKERPLLRHIRDVLGKYKDVLTNELPQELPPRKEVDYKIEMILGSELPSNTPYRLNQKEYVETTQ